MNICNSCFSNLNFLSLVSFVLNDWLIAGKENKKKKREIDDKKRCAQKKVVN